MGAEPPRPAAQRRDDALALLARPGADAWVATASPNGEAHLVPLSFGWTGATVVLVTEQRSRTSSNIVAAGRARIAFGETRDVVMVDAKLVRQGTVSEELPTLVEGFATQSGWDPRREPDPSTYVVFELRPDRMQVWRESNEIAGRTIMRDGEWLR